VVVTRGSRVTHNHHFWRIALKRFLLAALLMLVISAFVVIPAFAMDTCDHEMVHEPTVAALVMHVQEANGMGHIKSVLMPSLMAALNTAGNEALPVASRAGALQAFIGLVNAQAGKGINADCAAHLVMHAQSVIAALNG
jgi:hypothetical protein